MDNTTIKKRHQELNDFFASGRTKDLSFRKTQLQKLEQEIIFLEQEIYNALWADLHKSPEEAYLTEISIVLQEIKLHLKNLRKWAKPQRMGTPIYCFPSRSSIKYEPLGVALIISPWNYPFQLMLNPLIGAISSGCCAMLKTSPSAPHTSAIIEKIVDKCFSKNYVSIAHGDREVNTAILDEKWDMICFTGSPSFGKIVYQAASKHLTPVILELGGKSPCIVDSDANIKIAARRIAWGKFINAGQTCIAPDYLYVHESVKDNLIKAMREEIKSLYGENTKGSSHYPRIITDNAFERLTSLIDRSINEGGNIVFGGLRDKSDKYISPTIIEGITSDMTIMQDEIFGPILPIMTFRDMNQVISYVNSKEKPLALYFFGKNNANKVLHQTSSGGVCINDTIMHIVNHNLPFGGVGNSGTGRYHGKVSFLAFSNHRAVVKTGTWIDLPMKYAPYKWFKLIKKIL